MDSIKAIKGLSPHMGKIQHLSIYVNGVRLDELVAQITQQQDYLGLIPAWLNYYDEDFTPSIKEKQYVWEQTKLTGDTRVLPILLCPDDFDFGCTVVVVEVTDSDDKVIWSKFGIDITEFDPSDNDLPKYIGVRVNWFECPGPYIFCKTEYLECIREFQNSNS